MTEEERGEGGKGKKWRYLETYSRKKNGERVNVRFESRKKKPHTGQVRQPQGCYTIKQVRSKKIEIQGPSARKMRWWNYRYISYKKGATWTEREQVLKGR